MTGLLPCLLDESVFGADKFLFRVRGLQIAISTIVDRDPVDLVHELVKSAAFFAPPVFIFGHRKYAPQFALA